MSFALELVKLIFVLSVVAAIITLVRPEVWTVFSVCFVLFKSQSSDEVIP